MKGLGANVEPILKIPAQEYYLWQRFFQIPFFFMISVLFAGIVRLLSIPFSGQGAYEDHFALFCVAQTLPMFITMWVPETIYFAFFSEAIIYSLIPVWFDIARQITGILWPLTLLVMGIARIEKISWPYAVIIMLIAAIPVTLMMVIFIR